MTYRVERRRYRGIKLNDEMINENPILLQFSKVSVDFFLLAKHVDSTFHPNRRQLKKGMSHPV